MPADSNIRWNIIAEHGGALLLENQYVLPFGFMTDAAIMNYRENHDNPFLAQNDLFRRATGIGGDLFQIITPTNHIELRFEYQMPHEACLYVFIDTYAANDARVLLWDTLMRTVSVERGNIFHAGSFDRFSTVAIEMDGQADVPITIIAAVFNHELFREGFNRLAANPLNLTHFSDTRIQGNVMVTNPGILYISLPHNDLWRVFVHGEEQEIITIGGAMTGIMINTAGEHDIELRFHNRMLNIGLVISILSILTFIALCNIKVIKKLFRRVA